MTGDRRIALPLDDAMGEAGWLAEARFIPQRYEPNYPYPLLVLLHGRGADEQQLIRAMPALSWRNYVGLALRGPEVIQRRGRPVGYGWGPDFARPDRRPARGRSPESAVEVVRRSLEDRGALDPVDLVERGVFAAVRQLRRSLHVHSERIFLVGTGEGAAVAYRLGLTHPGKFAGVVALNGWIPAGFRALGRLKECRRELAILVAHGAWNARAPLAWARRDVALLRNAGLKVSFQTYPCANRLGSMMLTDVDSWLIHRCTADLI